MKPDAAMNETLFDCGITQSMLSLNFHRGW